MPNNKAEFQALLRRLAAPGRTPSWPDAPLLAPGTVVANTYSVVRLASRGGMGEVYEARGEQGERVALKCLLPALAADPRAVARFQREARAVAELVHPQIVRQLAAGSLQDGRPFLAMEWCAHGTLAELLAQPRTLVAPEALALGLALSSALSVAHARGLIHRDVKPSNIFLGEAEHPFAIKLGDFGIAKFRAEATLGLTTTGTTLGSPHYMAPEQIEAQRELDARADVYALGVVLYEALSGALPFTGRTYGELALSICTGRPTALSSLRPELPAALHEAVARAIARQPADRFRDMHELADSLRLIPGAPVEAVV